MNLVRRLLNTTYVAGRACIERYVPFWSIRHIEALQRMRLHSIIRHAYNTVPFYRGVMDDLGLKPASFAVSDLAKLPLLDASFVRAHVDEFISTDCSERQAFYTSGTHSGVQRLIYWDHASLLHELAYRERDRTVMAGLVGRDWGQRQLFILPQGSLAFNMREFWDGATCVPRPTAERRALSDELPIETVVEHLNNERPEVVISYGSYADLFARTIAGRHMRAALPRVWVYGSDVLSSTGRAILEDLGCLVYTTYGATETLRLGFQCEQRRGLHLNVDLCAVRLVDECGNTVAPGETGEVVISNLRDRAMVLLNYRLGDLAALDPRPCPCGRSLPLLDRLQGRRTEVIRLRDGRCISAAPLEVGCEDVLADALAAQIVQHGPDQVCWRIVPLPGADREAMQRALPERTRAILGADVRVVVEFLTHVSRTPQGKLPRVIPCAPEQ